MTVAVFDCPDFDGHEQVMFAHDAAAGLRAIIAVHSTARGPALGGCRIQPYRSEAAALADVLRLSRGMTFKAAAAGLPFGGGKMVVVADPRSGKSPDLLRAAGTAIDRLAGRYVTGEDVGTTVEDMAAIRASTEHVFGLPARLGGSGDPSPSTALGCFVGIRACIAQVTGTDDPAGATVAVQGLGNVGWRLCELLARSGARLVVSDLRPDRVREAVGRFDAVAAAPDEVEAAEADVFAPCALGGVVDDRSLPRLRARIVAGAANNQLAEPRHADGLRDRGILYAPDYVINAGGMIQLAGERLGFGPGEVDRRVNAIGTTLREIFAAAEAGGLSTQAAADRLVQDRLAQDRLVQATPGRTT